MGGLECNELSINQILENNELFRFDAEYFNKKALRVIHNIVNSDFKYLGDVFDISKLAGFEFTKYFTEDAMSSDDNYIALTSKNIQTETLSLGEYITIDKYTADNYLQRSKLKPNDVILSYTGEYRRALTLRYENYQLGPNVCRLTPIEENTISIFYSAYLNSKTGQKILDREKTLSAQPTVAMQRIRKIPVPSLEEAEMKEFKDMAIEYYRLLDETDTLMQEANDLLESEIHSNSPISNQSINIRDYNHIVSTERIDSEYYLEKYNDIKKIIKSYKNGFDTFFNLCSLNDSNFIPEDDKEYDYIELANVEKEGFISGCTHELGADLPTRARRRVETNDVILSSIEGSLMSIAIINEDYNQALCSTGFYVVKSDYFNPETLCVLFKNGFIQKLLKQECSGTILTGVSKDNLANIILPKIESGIQTKIKEKVSKANKLRKDAHALYNTFIDRIDEKYYNHI